MKKSKCTGEILFRYFFFLLFLFRCFIRSILNDSEQMSHHMADGRVWWVGGIYIHTQIHCKVSNTLYFLSQFAVQYYMGMIFFMVVDNLNFFCFRFVFRYFLL